MYVCICVSVNTHTCMLVCAPVHVQRADVGIVFAPLLLSIYIFEVGPFSEDGAPIRQATVLLLSVAFQSLQDAVCFLYVL